MGDPLILELARRRENLWLTRRAVARRAGLGLDMVQSYERGDRCPGLWAVQRWADALGCDVVLVPRDGKTGLQRRPDPVVRRAS